ncbi:glycine-rich cell wall structural protein 1.8-like [Panicum virgatum]|uniref:Uncharacterized protein n=1 Tax=Panicum virgatum TaxID=38727 RepID=A0A8T0RNW7_PANVG|nr:glycine-rich cell wall structural protein 1.8-like [Panicum virgatum]KAG2586910.1 hypothetical protein PVAP13_5NG091581 [Panicum virgatum]
MGGGHDMHGHNGGVKGFVSNLVHGGEGHGHGHGYPPPAAYPAHSAHYGGHMGSYHTGHGGGHHHGGYGGGKHKGGMFGGGKYRKWK